MGHLTPEDVGTVEYEELTEDLHGEGEPLEDMALPHRPVADDVVSLC